MILDLVVLLIIVIYAISGYKKGFLYSVIGIFGTALAAAISSLVSSFFSLMVYKSFFMQPLTDTIQSLIDQLPISAAPIQISDYVIQEGPSFIGNILAFQHVDSHVLADSIGDSYTSSAQVVESFLRPVFVQLITIVMTAILFGILLTILKVVSSKATTKIDETKLGIPNRIFGLIFCIGEGLVVIMVFTLVFQFIMTFVPGDAFTSIQGMINDSIVYKYIYSYNLPGIIIDALTIK